MGDNKSRNRALTSKEVEIYTKNPLGLVSISVSIKYKYLKKEFEEILELSQTLVQNGKVNFEYFSKLDYRAWVWLLGSFHVIDKIDKAFQHTESTKKTQIQNLKKQVNQFRTFFAKEQAPGKKDDVPFGSFHAGMQNNRLLYHLDGNNKDLLILGKKYFQLIDTITIDDLTIKS